MSNIARTSKEIQEKLIINETIAASGSFTSEAISLTGDVDSNGDFSIQVNITGDGTAKIEYSLSNDGVTYITPTGVSEIATGLTKTTNTTGNDMYSFSPMLARFIKIIITETGTSNSVTIAATLLSQ
jgi:hypothetical protein